jgi:hypothetical protein
MYVGVGWVCFTGALLTICWNEGQITNVPMYFALSRTTHPYSNGTMASSTIGNGNGIVHDRASFQF